MKASEQMSAKTYLWIVDCMGYCKND